MAPRWRYGDRVIQHLVRTLAAEATTTRIGSAADLRAFRSRPSLEVHTVDQAVVAGVQASGMGWAFAAGYQAALARLDPQGMGGGVLASLCATEEGGGHPKAIRSTLVANAGGNYALTGKKTWVTLGSDASLLLVVASVGADAEGRNRLRVARVPSSRRGVTVQPGRPTPFAPEIGHAVASFEGVEVAAAELLPGDGYDDALKPFRTVEDIHVTAALLAWALGVGRASGWSRAWTEDTLGAIVLLRALSDAPPSAPETHVVLAGAQREVARLLEGAEWAKAAEPARLGWERDRKLLEVASSVRAARLEAAWKALAPRG